VLVSANRCPVKTCGATLKIIKNNLKKYLTTHHVNDKVYLKGEGKAQNYKRSIIFLENRFEETIEAMACLNDGNSYDGPSYWLRVGNYKTEKAATRGSVPLTWPKYHQTEPGLKPGRRRNKMVYKCQNCPIGPGRLKGRMCSGDPNYCANLVKEVASGIAFFAILGTMLWLTWAAF